MSTDNRGGTALVWEPAPFFTSARAAERQKRGFQERAIKPITWRPLPRDDFPSEGIFGHQKEWFSSFDVEFVASHDGEDLLLIRNIWFGFPDPPEWGLASRPNGRNDVKWMQWGYFADLPSRWIVPATA